MASNYSTSEVTEDDMICGFEVSPIVNNKEDNTTAKPTLSMATVSTDDSSSWSFSSSSTGQESSSFESEVAIILDMSESSDVSTPEVDSSPVEEVNIMSACRRAFTPLPPIEEESFIGPITPHQYQMTKLNPLKSDSQLVANLERYLLSSSTISNNGALVNSPGNLSTTSIEFINLTEPWPLQNCSLLASLQANLLCQVNLRHTDIPGSDKPAQSAPASAIVEKKRLSMGSSLPNQASIFLSRDTDSHQLTVVFTGSLSTDAMGLSSVFRRDRSFLNDLRLQCVGFGQQSAAMQRNGAQFPSDLNSMRIQLTKWRKRQSKKVKRQKRRQKYSAARKKQLEEEGTKVVCSPKMLPLVATAFGLADEEKQPASNDVNLFQDEELRAVLDITDNGNDTSALFPSLSSDLSSHMSESDDGLVDEMFTLRNAAEQLRRELDAANMLQLPQQVQKGLNVHPAAILTKEDNHPSPASSAVMSQENDILSLAIAPAMTRDEWDENSNADDVNNTASPEVQYHSPSRFLRPSSNLAKHTRDSSLLDAFDDDDDESDEPTEPFVEVCDDVDDCDDASDPFAELDVLDRLDLEIKQSQSRTDMIITAISSDEELRNWTTRTSMGDLSTTSSYESHGSGRRSYSSRSTSSSSRNRVVRMPGTKGRKVRFAEETQEFLFDGNQPVEFDTIEEEDLERDYEDEEDDDEEEGSNSNRWAMENVLYAFEDMMESFTLLSCAGQSQTPHVKSAASPSGSSSPFASPPNRLRVPKRNPKVKRPGENQTHRRRHPPLLPPPYRDYA